MFSFTSFGVNLDNDLASLRQCIYTFRTYGQIYYDLPALILEENNACYFQLYFYDTGNEFQNRIRTQYNENLSAKVVEKANGNFRTKSSCASFANIKGYIFF